MVGVAQLAELPVVVRTVAGSNPVAHPYLARVAQLVRGGDLKNHLA